MEESGTDGVECNRKVASEKRVASTIRPLINARNLHLEYYYYYLLRNITLLAVHAVPYHRGQLECASLA